MLLYHKRFSFQLDEYIQLLYYSLKRYVVCANNCEGLFVEERFVLSRIYILHRKQIIQILIGVEIVNVSNLSTRQ